MSELLQVNNAGILGSIVNYDALRASSISATEVIKPSGKNLFLFDQV